ncbi:MAG: 2-oxoglutarate dehydrogenase complex dihydrolipoyllysine-residue succinyltransferase [Gammaproteobacteria bacterium]
MTIEVKVPQLPESVADATLVAWHKAPGEPVSRDENLVDLETDKVVLEVPAPSDGVLKEIRIQDGTTVTSGELLAILEEGAGVATGGNGSQRAVAGRPEPQAQPTASAARKLSPSVRRIIEEHNIDPDAVKGTGKDGRLTKADVIDFMDRQQPATREQQAPASAKPVTTAPEGRHEERVPMTRLRARIAERMVEANRNAAMLTSFNEVDLHEVMQVRKRYRDKFEQDHGVRLGFMSFFIKAAIEALRKYPIVNASIEDNDVVYHDFYDIGIAVSTDRGLVVPVLRDVHLQSFAEIEQSIADLAGRARDGSLTLEDLTGGTFTITNGGVFGSLMSTPILNPPQSAILGMHKIQQRPMAVDGEILVRPMMYVALTYDHRIIDGREAVLFLVTVKEMLEDPARLLLQL